MPRSLLKRSIIGVLFALLALLAGCSSLRLLYGSGPQLAWWWLDGYLDFGEAQAPQARAAIDRWFGWHRATQLGAYADLLGRAREAVLAPATPALACRWQRELRDVLQPALDESIELFADLVPALGEPQLKHLQQQFAKKNAEMRREYLQPDRAERGEKSVERVVERFEQLYGRAGDAQRRVIAAGVAASPFDPEAWIAERERRQRETVATLRRLVDERAPRDQTIAALHMLAERAERSPDPACRAYQRRLADYNCAFAAQLHDATTPEQRQAARERLEGWADDLRALAGS